jgi:hypothetical protein
MAIKLKDSTDIFDMWKMAQKYSCDDFHNMLKHKLINTKTKPVTLTISEDVITDGKELAENRGVSFSRLVQLLIIEEKERGEKNV